MSNATGPCPLLLAGTLFVFLVVESPRHTLKMQIFFAKALLTKNDNVNSCMALQVLSPK